MSNIEEELTTARVAGEAGYSPFYFSWIFKNEMGITLKDYVTRRKLVKASEKIVSGYRAVSYTHLDVYKRQDLWSFRRIGSS